MIELGSGGRWGDIRRCGNGKRVPATMAIIVAAPMMSTEVTDVSLRSKRWKWILAMLISRLRASFGTL